MKINFFHVKNSTFLCYVNFLLFLCILQGRIMLLVYVLNKNRDEKKQQTQFCCFQIKTSIRFLKRFLIIKKMRKKNLLSAYVSY